MKGRVLPPPALEYHPKSSNARFFPEAGRWNMTSKILTQVKYQSFRVRDFILVNQIIIKVKNTRS